MNRWHSALTLFTVFVSFLSLFSLQWPMFFLFHLTFCQYWKALCNFFLTIRRRAYSFRVQSDKITVCIAMFTKLRCVKKFLNRHLSIQSKIVQSPLYVRVTKKYDIYQNNNKKKPGYFGKSETVGTKKIFLWSKFFSFLD